MRSRIALVFAALLLGSCLAPAYGCAALPLITAVAGVVSEVSSWIGVIDSQAQASGALPPNYAQALKALKVAVAHLNDAAKRGPAAYEAAVAEFQKLYDELVAIVTPLGVRVAPAQGRLAAAAPGTVSVPSAGELGARLRSEGPR